MKRQFTVPGFVLASVCGAALVFSPLVAAPIAHAACNAGQVNDPRTGVCWSQAQTTLGISGTGGMCLPGRLGLCMAALQNSQIPGANLVVPAPPAGPAPSSWP
ncbi:hypothetical protein ACXDF8_13655 [Mycolicibacterium sp. CBM1]